MRIIYTTLAPDSVPLAPDGAFPPKQFVGPDAFAVAGVWLPSETLPSDGSKGLIELLRESFDDEVQMREMDGATLEPELFIPSDDQLWSAIAAFSREHMNIVGFSPENQREILAFYRNFARQSATEIWNGRSFVVEQSPPASPRSQK